MMTLPKGQNRLHTCTAGLSAYTQNSQIPKFDRFLVFWPSIIVIVYSNAGMYTTVLTQFISWKIETISFYIHSFIYGLFPYSRYYD